MTAYDFGRYSLALFLFAAGVSHFVWPYFYRRTVPLWFPAHKFVVAFSGVIEIFLAIGLLRSTTSEYAAAATALMLVIYLVIHLHMALKPMEGLGMPGWVLWIRVLFQFVLIGWALIYAGPQVQHYLPW